MEKVTGITKIQNNILTAKIPEPTRSLIFTTDENPSKFKNVASIGISINIFEEQKDKNLNIFSEPSLIWIKLPIVPNSNLEQSKMYYPSYATLNPECRYQYLEWLKDITKETNLSYVFLYYYGLERHLLIGNYDLAVDEVIRLVKYHNKGSFKSYASTALLSSSIYHKRPDILKRAPFILDNLTNIGLFLKWQIQKDIDEKEVIKLANIVGFKKRTYLKNKPNLFIKYLKQSIENYKKNKDLLINSIDLKNIKKDKDLYFANLSIPKQIRTIETPQIMENETFKETILKLLNETHEIIKQKVI
ncbi:MAG: TerB N-terminal domain-containing protein [Patescibacteria group bacterium]|nr:TerB N-terminal domain-containing protein [Patescibacteria group bacterium]